MTCVRESGKRSLVESFTKEKKQCNCITNICLDSKFTLNSPKNELFVLNNCCYLCAANWKK